MVCMYDIQVTHTLCMWYFFFCAECEKLIRKGSEYEGTILVKFLEKIGLSECTRNVGELDGSDLILGDDKLLAELGLGAIDRLRFRVLFQRELLQETSDVAQALPVGILTTLFKSEENPKLAQYASMIETNGIDGEMLLLAEPDVITELKIPAVTAMVMKKRLKEQLNLV